MSNGRRLLESNGRKGRLEVVWAKKQNRRTKEIKEETVLNHSGAFELMQYYL